MCPTGTILTVQRVRRFARRTRDYGCAYLALEEGGDVQSKLMVEWMHENREAHYNINSSRHPCFIENTYYGLASTKTSP